MPLKRIQENITLLYSEYPAVGNNVLLRTIIQAIPLAFGLIDSKQLIPEIDRAVVGTIPVIVEGITLKLIDSVRMPRFIGLTT